MSETHIDPIEYDPAAVMIEQHGLSPDQLAALTDELEAARAEVLADVELFRTGGEIPQHKQPLDAGFLRLPEVLLEDYRQDRGGSELGRLLATANRLADSVDRVVVLGIGGSYMGARALFEACCHPYHNELSRADRGGRPRIYFEGNNVDNDSVSGLLEVLGNKPAAGVDDRWGIVVISKSGGTLETAAAFRHFLAALSASCSGDNDQRARRIVPVTGTQGRLFELAGALGCPEMYHIPEGVGGRFSIFTAVGLLPAAILGLDVVKLLEGAAAMNARFRDAPCGENPVLDYVGVCHLMEQERGANIRILSTWGKRLEAAGMWYDQLLSESLGKDGRGALPLTVVNTRDLHSRGQQHQEGARDKLITNLVVRSIRSDRLAIDESDLNQDQLNELAGKTLPDIMAAALAGTNLAYANDQRPTADISLPAADEAALGQFFQMMMLATVVEGRLIKINPYGQPGVEDYKRHMNDILRGQ